MKALITGSAGRVGRAIYHRLCADHQVVGFDRLPSATSDVVASVDDTPRVRAALRGVDVVIHVAALHAPHVGHASDEAFQRVNVRSTDALARLAAEAGVGSFVFTSSTAVYGAASTPPGRAGWIDEDTLPLPRTIYHRSKLEAEGLLQGIAAETGLPVTVIRMSRCFPEPAPLMAAYRLHRGVDVRDVADAHALAALAPAPGFRRYLVSGPTPFLPADADHLPWRAAQLIQARCPALASAFADRRWRLPESIDRVYCPDRAMRALGWQPKHGFEEVLAQLDRRSPEVLPPSVMY